MKKRLILIGILTLLICLGFSGCAETGIYVEKLKEKPDNFVNMTEEQMNHFPHLKEAILTNKTIHLSSPSDEVSRLIGILEYFDTHCICYQNEYYEIHIYFAD